MTLKSKYGLTDLKHCVNLFSPKAYLQLLLMKVKKGLINTLIWININGIGGLVMKTYVRNLATTNLVQFFQVSGIVNGPSLHHSCEQFENIQKPKQEEKDQNNDEVKKVNKMYPNTINFSLNILC